MDETIEIEEVKPLSKFTKFKIKLADRTNRVKEWWRALPRAKRLGLEFSFGLAALLLVTGVGLWARSKSPAKSEGLSGSFSIPLFEPEEPYDHEAPLDGVMVTKSEYEAMMKQLPLAVIIENHTSARPQSGINKADLVYEALAEGGISRLMPIYLRQEASEIGPIRSTRSYFQDWVAEYDAIYMHIGGASSSNPVADALGQIWRYGIKSLNRGGTFWRKSEREAPHNAYSSTERLWGIAANLGWNGPAVVDKWQFKEDEDLESRPEESEIKFNWNGWGETPYSVRWVYEQNDNVYLREVGGVKDKDANSHEQIFAKNVVLQFSLQTLANDGTARILYQTTGEDRALVFMDGKVIEGKWKKPERTSRTKFYDSEGNELAFNRGTTWIEVLPIGSEVEYK